MSSVDEILEQATELLRADRVAEATQLCRDLLMRHGDRPEAHNLLGVLACRNQDFTTGESHFAQAARLDPGHAEYQRNLGFAQKQCGRLPQAAASFSAAVRLDPGDTVALYELGVLRQMEGGTTEALACFRRALEREPNSFPFLLATGNALARLGQVEPAARMLREALSLVPDSMEARFALAGVLSSLAGHAEAVSLYEDIARVRPDYPGLQLNLGAALRKLGRCADAVCHYDQAIAQDPGNFMAWNNRGNALCGLQRMEEATASFRRALEIRPDYANAHANFLLTLNYTESSQAEIYRESLEFEHRHAAELARAVPPHANDRNPARRLRVGYVSADFRRHSVAYFLRSVLAAHDRGQVEVFAYACLDCPADDMTDAIRAASDHWRPVQALGDEELSRHIRADGIDILVDLNGHTAGNRLLVFARKPAPVQVTWLGYPNTTGLRAIDYRLTDPVADPPGPDDALHTEKLCRLPGGFLCFDPGQLPPLPTTPAVGAVTFGSFNTVAKETPEVVAVWSAILQGVPGSRLVLKSESLDDEDTRRRFLDMFGGHAISADRLDLLPPIGSRAQHLAAYHRMDIALDPFPYNGTTTTFEALCMGVPVVALRGNRHAGRVGASILQHAGLKDWVADSTPDYIDLARTRGSDRRALAALRPAIRAAILNSPLTDARRFTAELELAYRRIWLEWCQSGPVTTG